MTTDQIVAAVAAGAGVLAAGIAGWQAGIARRQARDAREDAAIAQAAAEAARRQADAAEQQARSGEEQVKAAEAHVRAAEEQVRLLQRQLDAQEAERHEARGPQFIIRRGWVDRRTQRGRVTARVYLEQTAGPGLDTVIATATGPVMRDAENNTTRCRSLAVGGDARLTFYLSQNAPERGTIVLDLECTAATGEIWRRSISHDLSTRDPYDPFEPGAVTSPNPNWNDPR
ncbi:hypothetical protein [Kitasatospora griseola]|uniref:hypothetical protein n=1 Tax=Kitasatospora griseola TaxID=2064 RepID=UPI00365FCE1D